MIGLLVWTAAVLVVAAALLMVVLVLRRLLHARDERRRQTLEVELRPLALALTGGETARVPRLDGTAARVLAALVVRYARLLAGEARMHIAAFFEHQGHVDRELSRLDARRPTRRAAAAYALGDMGSPSAVAALLAALDDRNRDVRAAAVRSLGRLGAVEAVEPIVQALARRHVPRGVAAQALLTLGSPAVTPLRPLLSVADPEVRAVATDLVGLLGGADDVPALVERLRDSSAEVRVRAARALGRVGSAGAAAELRAALDDRIPFVRAAAAAALGAVGDPASGERLLALAKSDEFWPAHAAARALAQIDPQRLADAAARRQAGAHLREAAALAALGRG